MDRSSKISAKVIALLLAALISSASAQPLPPDPVEMLLKSDEIRFPRESFEVQVTVESSGEIEEERVMDVMSKGNENSIIFTKEPAIDYGQAILMRGRDLWVFMPDVSQAIRLSMSQRLTGQVANGDLARANFSGDYNPTILGEEEDHWILELVAVDRSVTYSRVKLWVSKSNHRPKKAEFFALSGRLLKTCEYLEFKQILGKMRPTKLIMTDAMRPGNISVLKYESMRLRELPDKLFTKNYLNKLANER